MKVPAKTEYQDKTAFVRLTPTRSSGNGIPPSSPVVPMAMQQNAANRRVLLVALVPLLLLTGTGITGAARRAIQAHRETVAANGLTRSEAYTIAQGMCNRLTGESSDAVDATFQSAVSLRHGQTIGEWDVLCRTGSNAQYLLRVNAETRRVYGVNRVDDGMLRATAPSPDLDSVNTAHVSRRVAEASALHYLNLMGISPTGLHPIDDAGAPTPVPGAPQYNFTYERRIPGLGRRLLKVSVSGEDGKLQHAWNPSFAL